MKKLYVIRFNTGVYWCGLNTVSSQLRKAKIYTSIKMADDAALDALKRYDFVKILDTKEHLKATEYNICEVELNIKGIAK